MSLLALALLLGISSRSVVSSTDLKALDDGVLFAMKWPGMFTDDILKDMEPGAELVDMNSSNGEKYKCVIPPMSTPSEEDRHEYAGPNALELLEPLIQQTSCSFRLESYWTYEICHGKYVRQYHQETGRAPKLQEYYLGKWEGDRFRKEVAKLTEQIQEKRVGPLPTKKIDGLNMPYVEMNMTDGTLCDLSGTPRSVRVLYICYRQGKHEIYSLEETRTCEYEVIVLSPLLCAHPEYRVRDQLQNDINCYAEGSSNRRPKALRAMESESLKLRHQTTILELTTGPGKRYTVEINPVDIQEVLDQADQFSAGLTSSRQQQQQGEDSDASPALVGGVKPVPKPEIPPYDAKLVEDFLAGTYCLHGGSGWWKYEFCYGKKVLQYHVEPDGSKTTLLLGQFDREAHVEWLKKNPGKKPKPGLKKTVSHFYGGGSLCDLTGKPRQVEVRLKCREAVAGATESMNAVSLYLIEPEVCSYVLGVETPSVYCDLLDTADEFGFMTAPAPPSSSSPSEPEIPAVAESTVSPLPVTVEPLVTVGALLPESGEDEEDEPKQVSDDEPVVMPETTTTTTTVDTDDKEPGKEPRSDL